MSEVEIREYMKCYTAMLMYELARDSGTADDGWYLKFKATGDLKECPMPEATKKKLKNKLYQLRKHRLDQSFIMWRIMNEKLDKLKTKPKDYNPNYGRTVFNNTTYGLTCHYK